MFRCDYLYRCCCKKCVTMSESPRNLVSALLNTLVNACTGQNNTGKHFQYCSTDEEMYSLFHRGRMQWTSQARQFLLIRQTLIQKETCLQPHRCTRQQPLSTIFNCCLNTSSCTWTIFAKIGKFIIFPTFIYPEKLHWEQCCLFQHLNTFTSESFPVPPQFDVMAIKQLHRSGWISGPCSGGGGQALLFQLPCQDLSSFQHLVLETHWSVPKSVCSLKQNMLMWHFNWIRNKYASTC